MNVEIFIGSPRKNGNTSLMSLFLNKNLVEKGISSNITYLTEIKLNPCIDCRRCKKNDLVCMVKDDGNKMYNLLDNADVIVFGTPIYWFGPTAQMKALLDRLRPYYVNRKLEGKKAAIILPAASGMPDCDLTIRMFKRIFKALGIEFLRVITSEVYDAGDVVNDIKALHAINELSASIISINSTSNIN